MTRIASAIVALLVLAGCETMEGFGRDVENTGEAIQAEAN